MKGCRGKSDRDTDQKVVVGTKVEGPKEVGKGPPPLTLGSDPACAAGVHGGTARVAQRAGLTPWTRRSLSPDM